MALEAQDLLVVQKHDGANEIRKCTLQQLDDFIAAGESVVYKGPKNFTQAGDEPVTKNHGDLYINTNDGTWAWDSGDNGTGVTTVTAGDRAIWNSDTVKWDVLTTNQAEDGVTSVTGTLPIVVEDGETATPNVKVNAATTATVGVVQLADAQAITDGTAGRVVDAAQLKVVDDKVDGALSGGIVSIVPQDPITVNTADNGATTNTPHVGIEDSGVGQKGAVAKYDIGGFTGSAEDSSGYATWAATLSDGEWVSMRMVATNFVPNDFSGLEDA